MDADLDAETYDALLADLAADVRDRPEEERGDAIWDAVGDLVPKMTAPVCARVLDLAEHEPDDTLVAEVMATRASDQDERRRAEAVTALVADLEARTADSEG